MQKTAKKAASKTVDIVSVALETFKTNYVKTATPMVVGMADYPVSEAKFNIILSKGKQTHSNAKHNLNGNVDEMVGELLQNSFDAGATKMSFEITEVETETLNKVLKVDELLNELDGTEPEDLTVAENEPQLRNYRNEYRNSKKVSMFIAKDNGPGLDGTYKDMAPPEELEEEIMSGRRAAWPKPHGGTINYYMHEGARNKGEDKGGMHNAGGKNTLENMSKLVLAGAFSRRRSDGVMVGGMHTNVGPRTKNGLPINPNILFNYKNQDLVHGEDAENITKTLGIYREPHETGVTSVVVMHKEILDFYSLLHAVCVDLMHAVQFHDMEITVTDHAKGLHAVVTKDNLVETFETLVQLAKDTGVNGNTVKKMERELESKVKVFKVMADVMRSTANEDFIVAYSDKEDDLPIAFSDEQRAFLIQKVAKKEPFAVKVPVTTQRANGEEVNGHYKMVVYPHGITDMIKKGTNFYDRDGININFENSVMKGASAFIHFDRSQGAAEVASLLRDAENLNHKDWSFKNNQTLAKRWKNARQVIESVKECTSNLFDYLERGNKNDIDLHTFASLFPDPTKRNKNSFAQNEVQTNEKDQDKQNQKQNKSKANTSESFGNPNYFDVTTDKANSEFVIEPSALARGIGYVPESVIVLGFEELASKANMKTGATYIRNLWEIVGEDADMVEAYEREDGLALVLAKTTTTKFALKVKNADKMRVPQLKIESKKVVKDE